MFTIAPPPAAVSVAAERSFGDSSVGWELYPATCNVHGLIMFVLMVALNGAVEWWAR